MKKQYKIKTINVKKLVSYLRKQNNKNGNNNKLG